MTRTHKIAAAASAALVLFTATLYWFVAPRTTHIILPPVQQGAQR